MNGLEIGIVAGAGVVAVGVAGAVGNAAGKKSARKELFELAEEKGGYITNEDIFNTMSKGQKKKTELGSVPKIITAKEVDKQINETLAALNKANKALEKIAGKEEKKNKKTA